jgi:heat shock protein HslJ
MGKFTIIASAMLVMMSVSSCSIFNKTTTTNSGGGSTETTGSNSSVQLQPQTPYLQSATTDYLAGEWIIYSVGGNKVTGDERPYINFDSENHRFYGSNGCNIINGDYAEGAHASLKLSNIISTMMSCPNADYEQAINAALDAVSSYTLLKKGNEYYLDLKNEKKVSIMMLRKHNMEFLNGTWVVSDINGISYNNPEMEMVIDTNELKLHGNTGCNIVNGSVYIDPDKSDSVQFLNLITTRMGCSEDNLKAETAMLVALESVEYAKRGRNNTVVMYDKSDHAIMVLKKVQVNRGE